MEVGWEGAYCFINIYNIDRTPRALCLVKNACFIRVQNIEKTCCIIFHQVYSRLLSYHTFNISLLFGIFLALEIVINWSL